MDTLVVELDDEACLLIGDVIHRLHVKAEEVRGFVITSFTRQWLPMNPFMQRIFIITNDDGEYHIDYNCKDDFVSYINFMDTRGEAQGVSLITKKYQELWN